MAVNCAFGFSSLMLRFRVLGFNFQCAVCCGFWGLAALSVLVDIMA